MSNIKITNIKITDTNDSTCTLTRTCPFCGKEHSITVDTIALADGTKKRNEGALIQHAYPSFSADEREFLNTGICPKCWDSL